MNTFTKIFTMALVLVGAQVASAGSSRIIDDADLGRCSDSRRSKIELLEAPNGNLSVQLDQLSTNQCNVLQFTDAKSGRVIKEYDIKGSNYTLSKEQAGALNSDCSLGVILGKKRRSGSINVKQSYSIDLPWWCALTAPTPVVGAGSSSADRGISFQLSRKGNCKLMLNGEHHKSTNVNAVYCQQADSRKDFISYDYSGQDNCKIMKNGDKFRGLTDDSFCEATIDDFR